MFAVFTRRFVVSVSVILALVISITVGVVVVSANTVAPIVEYVIVIDAGHGGVDGGVVGASGLTCEREINLEYAQCLASYFEAMNCKVVMTRTNSNGLYDAFSTNRKKDDMLKRQEIINNVNPDIVISLHQNGYVLPNQRGIGTFFNPENSASEELANYIQQRFIEKIDYARELALSGDYFILNCTPYTSVLIECGFLTNPEEEILLQQEVYKETVCYEIFCAVIGYLVVEKNL